MKKSKLCFDLIFGKNASLATMKSSSRLIKSIFLDRESSFYRENIAFLTNFIKNHKIDINFVDKKKLNSICKTEDKHQGIALKTEGFKFYDLHEICKINNKKKSLHSTLFLLDSVMDPQNMGAILRSAYAFDVDGVVIAKNNACDINGTVARSSTGYSEFIKIHKASNLASVIDSLKEQDYYVIGLDSGCGKKVHKIQDILSCQKKVVFIFGSEGFGIKKILLNKCDYLHRIDMANDVESLNVSVSCSIIGNDVFNFYKNEAQ